MRVDNLQLRRGPAEDGFADLGAWTRFVARGWRDPSVAAPGCDLPAADLVRLGIGPLAYRVLRDRGDARALQFEPHHRRASLQNLATVARVAPARELLGSRGITPVLIKGGAFLLRHSPSDLGVRAMADFDLLVGPERFDEAFAVLTEAGWRRASPELKYSSRVSPAVTLFSADAHGATVQIDLHRHLAQWPLLKELPAVVIAHAEEQGGWVLPSARHAALIVALHRARHAFANDGRDLLDLAVSTSGIDDSGWAAVLDEARALGVTGALCGAMGQAAWWFGGDGDPLACRSLALRARLGHVRVALLDRMAAPACALTQTSPWSGPVGRNFGVFPAAFDAPLRSLVAAAVFLPRRVMER